MKSEEKARGKKRLTVCFWVSYIDLKQFLCRSQFGPKPGGDLEGGKRSAMLLILEKPCQRNSGRAFRSHLERPGNRISCYGLFSDLTRMDKIKKAGFSLRKNRPLLGGGVVCM